MGFFMSAGKELRLVVCGYIRPEQNFTSLKDLVDRIHEDGRVSKSALQQHPFLDLESSPFLQPS